MKTLKADKQYRGPFFWSTRVLTEDVEGVRHDMPCVIDDFGRLVEPPFYFPYGTEHIVNMKGVTPVH